MKESEFFRQPSLVISFLASTNREMNISKLAKKFKLYQGNMAKLISKLEKFKIIKKEKSEKSKREIIIILTEKGKKIAKNMSKINNKLI